MIDRVRNTALERFMIAFVFEQIFVLNLKDRKRWVGCGNQYFLFTKNKAFWKNVQTFHSAECIQNISITRRT